MIVQMMNHFNRAGFLLLCLLAIPAFTYGQRNDVQTADSLFEFGDYSNSSIQYKKAAAAFSASNIKRYLYCQIQRAECDIRTSNLEAADHTIQESLKKCTDTYTSERALLENASAKIYMQKGQLEQADKQIQHAISLIQKQSTPDNTALAECYNTSGLIEWLSDHDEKALEYLSQALSIRTQLFGENHPLVAAVYNNIGLVYSDYDEEEALQQYEHALSIYQKLYKEIHPSIAIAYSNVGQIYRKQEVYNTALINYEKSLAIWNTLYKNNHPTKAFVFSSIAQVYEEKEEYANALKYAQNALSIYKEFYGEKHPNTAACYTLMGSVYSKQSDYTNGLNYYQSSLISNCSDFNNTDYRTNPSVQHYFDGQLLLSTFTLKSLLLEKREAEKTLRIKDLTLALSTYQSCDTLLDQLRQTRTGKNDKIALGNYSYEVYDHSIHLCILLSENTAHKKKYTSLAYYFVEKSKASVLQESIAESKAKSYAGIPESELKQENELKSSISYLEQKLAKGVTDEAEMKSVSTMLFAQKRAYEAFIQSMEKNYPAYYNLKYNVQPITIAGLQKKLQPGDCILEYLVSESTHSIYVFRITQKYYDIYSIPATDTYEKYIAGLRNAIRFDNKVTFIKTASSLYDQLIPSIPKHITHLIIIPDGKMSALPFETLLSKKPKTDSIKYADMNFLIKDYSVSYNYAGSLYNAAAFKTSEKGKVLLFAPVDFNSSALNTLPGTLTEVTNLDTLFQSYGTARLYTRNGAQRSVLTDSSVTQYNIIHLATHGLVDETTPELSCIYTSGTNEDNDRIYSGDLYNMHMHADLVTLSACQTGLGKISKGEGMIGLSRALFYSGADNIMVSLWSVSDASTQLLMTDFYKSYLSNTTTTSFYQASRNAKLQLLRSDNFSGPYYWAAFVLIGE